MWARIEEGTVVELTDADPKGRFHAALAWRACAVDTKIGWVDNGDGSFSAPPQPSVADLAADKNAEINNWRQQANHSTFPYAGKSIACDALSRGDIDGVNGWVALTGELPPDFPGGWKATDNSYISLPDGAAWMAFYAAMVAQGAANFARAQQLKGVLAAIVANAEMSDDDKRGAIATIQAYPE